MATGIKVPGVFEVGTGDHWGTTDGIKDTTSGLSQAAINSEIMSEIEKRKSEWDAMTDDKKSALLTQYKRVIITEQ